MKKTINFFWYLYIYIRVTCTFFLLRILGPTVVLSHIFKEQNVKFQLSESLVVVKISFSKKKVRILKIYCEGYKICSSSSYYYAQIGGRDILLPYKNV